MTTAFRLASFVFGLLIACLPLLATDQVGSFPETVQAARRTYEVAVSDAQEVYDTLTQQSGREYTSRLDKLIEQRQSAGDLDAVVAMRKQQDKVSTGDIANVPDLPQAAIKAKTAWLKSLEDAKVSFDNTFRKAHQILLKELVEAEKVETMSGRIDVALSIRSYRMMIEKSGPPNRAAFKTFRQFAGRWSVRYANGATVVIEISSTGIIRQSESEDKLPDAEQARLEAVEINGSPAILQTYSPPICLNRYMYQKNDQLLVEQWTPAAAYPAAQPWISGVAMRLGK